MPRAARCRAGDRAVELPGPAGARADRRCDRGRQRGRAQAVGGRAAHVERARAPAPRVPRPRGGRGRRGRRRRDDGAARRALRPHLLHGQRQGRPRRDGGRARSTSRRSRSSSAARARRSSTQSADLDVAARRIAWGKFLNAGQTCIAPDYVLVARGKEDHFIELVRRSIFDFYGDDPQESPDYARIVNDQHFERLTGLLDSRRQRSSAASATRRRATSPRPCSATSHPTAPSCRTRSSGRSCR